MLNLLIAKINEIYAGYGSKLEKKRTWEVNGVNKTEILSLGLAHLKGEELSSKNLIDSPKGNLFYSLDQNIPLSVDKPKSKIVTYPEKVVREPGEAKNGPPMTGINMHNATFC